MSYFKLTKIVATVGPACDSPEQLSALLEAGANVLRFNTKHNTPEWHNQRIKLAQRVADGRGEPVGILLDLQGPEIRLETRNQAPIAVSQKQHLALTPSFVDGIDVIIPHSAVFGLMRPGDELLIDDGFVETEVVSVKDNQLIVEIKNDSVIKHRKGVNLPGKDIDFPSLIESDIAQLDKNAGAKIDFVGLSFVRSAHDLELLRAELLKREMSAKIVAKIESQPALDRLDEIIESADAVMIARGDLGVEVPFEQLAYWQRLMIDKCRLARKPVITATQMLESMINNPRPTRAEVTDVAHAIFEGTDAIMLSGETASGKYPVRAVETMAKIAVWNEARHTTHHLEFEEDDPTNTVANAVAHIARSRLEPKIDQVLVFTETGYTARALAKHRLPIPIIAATNEQKTAETLTLSYGVEPIVTSLPEGLFDSAQKVLDNLVQQNLLHQGDTLVVVHGQHWQKPGNTNSLSIVTL